MTRTARLALALLLAAGIASGTVACTGVQQAGDGVQQAGETMAYPMVEGDTVFVDPTQLLPANVINDIAAMSQLIVDAIPGPDHVALPGEEDLSLSAVSTIAHRAAWARDATGREIIIIYRVWGTPDVNGSPGTPQWLWAATRGASQTAIPDKAAQVADVDAYVAAQDDPGAYEVIVLT